MMFINKKYTICVAAALLSSLRHFVLGMEKGIETSNFLRGGQEEYAVVHRLLKNDGGGGGGGGNKGTQLQKILSLYSSVLRCDTIP